MRGTVRPRAAPARMQVLRNAFEELAPLTEGFVAAYQSIAADPPPVPPERSALLFHSSPA